MDPLRRQLTDPHLLGLSKIIDLFRLMDREVPAQVIMTFLYIAAHDNCHKQALEEDLDMTTASSSRNTDWLSDQHRLNKPGLGLIIKKQDPANRRRITLCLSNKGRTLIALIKDALND
jgi:DNA-binding MarR family transcriptional regulator